MSLTLRLVLIVCGVFVLYLLGSLAVDYIDQAAEERRAEILLLELLGEGSCEEFDGSVVCVGDSGDGPVVVEHDEAGDVVNVIPIEP